MADMAPETENLEVPEIPELLESLLIQVIDEAKAKLGDEGEFAPFTAIVVGDQLIEQNHSGETEECFASAEDTVKNTPDAIGYAFCFDGFIKTNEGDRDCIIAEGGMAGAEKGFAFGCLYNYDEEAGFSFDEDIYYLDEAPCYLADREAMELVSEEIVEESL